MTKSMRMAMMAGLAISGLVGQIEAKLLGGFTKDDIEWMIENIGEIKTYQLFKLKKIGHARLSQACDEEIQRRKVASDT